MGEDRKEAASLSRDKGGSPGDGEKWSREISGPPKPPHGCQRHCAGDQAEPGFPDRLEG